MSDRPVPVVVLASTDPLERDVALMTALVDAPGWVAVIHELVVDDDGPPHLLRRVLGPGGEDRVEIDLEHVCAGCAMREDAVPALVEQLDERPAGVVLALPVGAELLPATRTLTAAVRCGALRGARLAGTVATVATDRLLEVLDDGEDAVVAQLMGAAVVLATGDGARERDVVDALRSPSSVVVADACEPWLARAAALDHDDDALERICDPQAATTAHGFAEPVALADDLMVGASGVWELRLRSERPFHPARLLRAARRLGASGAVSRGRFWVPNRPDSCCGWDAVSGLVSIGVVDDWDGPDRDTSIRVVGFDADPDAVRAAFVSALLTDEEHAAGPVRWLGRSDPLAPYLGDAGRRADGAA